MKRYPLAMLGLCGSLILAGCGGNSAQITKSQPVFITSSAPPAGTVGVPYGDFGSGFAPTSSGGVQPYHWSWAAASGSSLPPGLAFSDLGLTGQPTSAGTYSVVITVTDSQSPPAQASTPYSITIAPMAPLAITGTPPNGFAGEVYSPYECGPPPGTCGSFGYILRAQGGVQPYGWMWAGAPGSTTPPGLQILSHGRCPDNDFHSPFNTWRIACIPTTGGTYNVVITVNDSASPPNQVSANFTIKIQGLVINTSPSPSQGAIHLPYNFQFSTSYANYNPVVWNEMGALPPGLNLASDGTLSGTPTSTGSFPITVMAKDPQGNSDTHDFTIVVGEHGFKATGNMTTGRALHTATLLSNGKVLITGGQGNNQNPVSAELYDPATGTFSTAGDMTTARQWFTATLLQDGKVLIAGGYGDTALDSAEVFDPASGSFSPTGNMTAARFRHTATLLSNGKVLIAGGANNDAILDSAELFDPATGTFTATGSMATTREFHTATALQTGKVLVAGGDRTGNENLEASAEIYDPATGTFSSAGNMSASRFTHSATLLMTGRVLIAGGGNISGCPAACAFNDLASAELFDPATGTFALTGSMATGRRTHTATLLSDGTVLMAGGGNGDSDPPYPLTLAEIFNPNTGTFSGTGSLLNARANHTATLLNDGTVLVTGGEEFETSPPFLTSAEVYH
jgi:hypothetical protein